ncbi:MAG: hypothetical protein ACFFC3_04225 [Candidatus Odinarchaeota archaeon]
MEKVTSRLRIETDLIPTEIEEIEKMDNLQKEKISNLVKKTFKK